jgi:hypothetical protein
VIPSIEDTLAARAFLVRRFSLDARYDRTLLEDCLRQAVELAGGRVDDELAATLFVLTRRPRALGGAWERVPLMLLANDALARGFTIACGADNVELTDLRLGIVAGFVTYEQVRAWVSSHLHPR